MGLTKHQEEILNKSLDILTTSNRLLIKGSAGVGKTYMVNELLKSLSINGIISKYKQVYCSAPTNKAVSVLKNKVTVNVEFITVHSALKLKQYIDRKTGDVTFKPYFNEKYPPLKEVGLLVVDEASMINTEILDYIEKYASTFSVKVIFIGDSKQLNPVGEDNSPVFHCGYPELELTEIIRQGEGNPIIDLSRNLTWINNRQDNYDDHGEDSQGFLFSNDKEYIIDKLCEANGTDELKYLAWTNKDVDSVNSLVRERIYGDPNKIELGETIVFNTPYKEKYFTNEELTVNSLDIDTVPFRVINKKINLTSGFISEMQDFKCYIINGVKVGRFWSSDSIFVIHEEDDKKFRVLKSTLLAACKNRELDWILYYNFLSNFADFKYNHALSIHKSQGSTYKKTVVNIKNVMLNKNSKERERLLYTAVTRASDLLVLYNI